MANVFDVARYILHKQGRISTWALQKLCYYSQAWAMAWTARPLFDEEFQAWVNGPVCPELFNIHRGKYYMDESMMVAGNIEGINADERETIDIVLGHYGSMEPYQLRELTHAEDPWVNARKGLKDSDHCDNIITKDSMGEYYGGL